MRTTRRAGVAYGVDIGGTKVLGVAYADDGTVVAERRASTPHLSIDPARAPGEASVARAGGELADAAAGVVRALRADLSGEPGPVGVGFPGMVDFGGVLRFAPHLGAAAGADIRTLVSRRLDGEPVQVANDANCTAFGELALGAARGFEDVLVVTLGTGIGGALVMGGRIVTGAHGFSGEIGHMVVDPNGPPCPCGKRGCWERYASGGGLARLAREAALAGTLEAAVALTGGDPEAVRGEHVTSAAASGDPGARRVVEELGWWLGLGLANLVAVLDPEVVVIGGGLARVGDVLLDPARAALAALVEGGSVRPPVPVRPAALGEHAGAIGAALAARGDEGAPSSTVPPRTSGG